MFRTRLPLTRAPRGAALGLGLGVALALAPLSSGRAAEAGVTINDNRTFSPNAVTVSVGDTVTWTNSSKEDHNLRGGPFSSPVLKPGNRYSFTFTKAETVKYACDIHPTMRGTVTVK